MRVGIIGGTFDPPHYAHLIMAESAREQFGLQQVLWVVAADPPHKRLGEVNPIAHRLSMLRLAIDDNPSFGLSLIDVERAGPHYSVDMLDIAADAFPDSSLYFMIGSDSLRDLPRWHQPHRLLDHVVLAVMSRPYVSYDWRIIEQAVPGASSRVVWIDAPLVALSGTSIRDRVRSGRTIRYLLPRSVENYIIRQGLYRATT